MMTRSQNEAIFYNPFFKKIIRIFRQFQRLTLNFMSV